MAPTLNSGQAVDEHLEVQLPHARYQRLAGLVVDLHHERGVLVGQPAQRAGQLVLIGLRLRLDGHGDDRLGEVHRLQDDGVVAIADRVARGDVAQSHRGADVARPHFLDLFALVRVHLQQAADALGVALRRIEHRGS